ncbi:glycosyltransferase family A protein [Leptolyngbya sp. FACHB-711]|uniref:glycosyltransferase family A protein n=1 Tax=unclassified Leptolyngbya TaxID=2650499 RepID=UPI0016874F1A|nr:glycosyltransferase family A protein [Leptolyngbya sp. FACHB-711]MBD1848785.1 glycosyltransferase family 2 protein [Cyanobacteria bacterium FACHB-502]MBD2027130.1 glycosyltransferase family 2 protein [Leptolyngbya sp. FACHB-711]
MNPALDVLIPTCNRSAALAVTLTSLCAQTFTNFRVIVSDQTETNNTFQSGEVIAALRVLEAHGHSIATHRHLPRRGLAEHRQFLLDQATAPYVLFLDDDLILEPWVIGLLMQTIQQEQCGFVGSAVIGLSFKQDVRPHQQILEWWEGAVEPEIVRSGTPQWERYKLHNAANLYHVQQQHNITPDRPRKYRVAWIGGCVLYDRAKLLNVGSFEFWRDLPENHCGEDVLAQLRVMSTYGGCGVMPSGVYHQEIPTTIHDRHNDAPQLLSI